MWTDDQLDLAAALIAELDAIQGDADFENWLGFLEQEDQTCLTQGMAGDLEYQCEDEGARSEDEGGDEAHVVPTYADDGHDQTRILTRFGVVCVAPRDGIVRGVEARPPG